MTASTWAPNRKPTWGTSSGVYSSHRPRPVVVTPWRFSFSRQPSAKASAASAAARPTASVVPAAQASPSPWRAQLSRVQAVGSASG